MKRFPAINICIVVAVLAGLSACLPRRTSKPNTDWRINLSEKSSSPYGCRLAWDALPYYFPRARIQRLDKSFRYNHMGESMWQEAPDSATLLILEGLDFFISNGEWQTLKVFMEEGHEVLLLCSRLDARLEEELGLSKMLSLEEQPLNIYNDGMGNAHLLQLANRKGSFGYQGRSLQGFFKQLTDSTILTPGYDTIRPPVVLGSRTDAPGMPNVLRFQMGKGHLTLHAAPLVLSNYFLLQENNRFYLEGLLHTLPSHINKVYWQSYYRRQRQGSNFSVLWQSPATRSALLLALFTLLLYVLFEMKRRQRIIPQLPQPENTSVAFATTIGMLYYHQGNHTNMAHKMWQHFQEWLRQKHNLEVQAGEAHFAKKLAGKTGQSMAQTNKLLYYAGLLQQEHYNFGADDLRLFYEALQAFYHPGPAPASQEK